MILPEELIPYKTAKKSSLRILVIDSDSLFGNILTEKTSIEKKDYEILVSEDNFTSGYLIAKMPPDIIVIKASCRYTNPEKLKKIFEKEKIPKPLILQISDIDQDESRGYSDTVLNYPVDFNIMFDYIDKNSGTASNGLKN